jgi:bacterioferritin
MLRANETLVAGLNQALNREIAAVIRYMLQGSIINGLENEPLRQIYRQEVNDELKHAQYLADKIVMLGGTPRIDTEIPAPVTDVEEMMERDLLAEETDIVHYRRLAELAEAIGDTELKLKMEEQGADETRHAERLRRFEGLALPTS